MASQELINIIIKATDEASAAAEKVSDNLNKIKDSSSRLSSIPGFDTMKTKLSNVAQTIDSKFGGALTKARNKFTSFKNGIGNVASTIKGKFGGALDGVRAKLSSVTNGTKNLEGGMSFLKGAVSMTAGMIGFELVNSLMETTRASLNARSSMQAFAQRLDMSSAEVDKFQKSLDEMQNSYKKIDMDVVGQQATDMAYRLGLPKQSLSELTETTAIFTDAMQRNGRSAEDSMLAMSDAMDGQFVRLKEIGIGQDDLMKNGWDGDINNKTGLLDAMNKSLKEQHYDDLAKSVDTLDDAWQVLSITLSNLLESVLVPLTPVIVGIIDAFTNAASTIKSAWDGLPDWGKIAIGIGALAVALGILVPALGAVELASLPLVGTLMSIGAAVTAISWPIVAVVAAIGLIALAVYEVGKAFGWWTDVGSMIDAISAGVQRLWSAFINHPAVQAAIAAISNAISTLWSWIQQAGQAILEFFNINSEGNFDIVRAIIDTVGAAWDGLYGAIMTVVGAVTTVWNAINWVAGQIWAVIGPFVMQIVGFIQNIINTINAFKAGQMSLPQFIWTILSLIVTHVQTMVSMVISRIVSFGSRMVAQGISAATRFVNGIVNWLRQLPGRVYSALIGVVGRIASAISHWASTASSHVQTVISNITSPFRGVVSAISSALSGVADAIKAPFQQAWDLVSPIIDNIKAGIDTISNALSFGGEAAYGGETINDVNGNSFNISSGQYIVEADNSPIEINDNINLSLDLRNVPSHINTGQLIEALSDKNVLSAIANNRDFQDIDAKVKQRISLKTGRARGR